MKKIFKSIVEGDADATLLHNNANKAAERIPVMKNMLAGEVAKLCAEDYLDPEVVAAHRSGDIHFHDMDESPLLPFYNCALIDVNNMLTHGFKMGNADIETPKSISTACAIVAQIIAQVACHQYGGVSINRLDEILEPYVSMSYEKHLSEGKQWMGNDKAVAYAIKLTNKEVKDAFQGLEYEVNTLFTSQGQTPFVTFGFGLGTTWQAKAIQEAILRTRLKGLGKQGRTAIFPKLVYMLDEGINMLKTDPNYDIKVLATACASERNYPDVVSMPALRKVGGGCTPMGCRSFLHYWEDETGTPIWDGRNNLGVVSVNLPRIGIEVSTLADKEEVFFDLLDIRLETCKKALLSRIERLKGVKAKVAPILYCEGALGFRLDPEDEIMQVFENGRASISLGYLGLHETVQALFGSDTHPYDDTRKQVFMHRITNHLKTKVDNWKKDTGWAFSLYSTPSESLCDRFCRLDNAKFGDIEDVTDKEYYTNSFHLDVRKAVSPFSKIDFEEEFHKDARGGHISFSELPNVELHYRQVMIESLWDYAFTRVPYYGTNCVIDYCHSCNVGIDAVPTENGFSCPHCGSHDSSVIEVTKRVCGYLGSPDARPFIKGKQQELINRAKHI